jgi:hypothetical protein
MCRNPEKLMSDVAIVSKVIEVDRQTDRQRNGWVDGLDKYMTSAVKKNKNGILVF